MKKSPFGRFLVAGCPLPMIKNKSLCSLQGDFMLSGDFFQGKIFF